MPDRSPLDAEHLYFVLDYLGDALDPSILIGGWATFLRVEGDISHDIDLIIGSDTVRSKIPDVVEGYSTSTHLPGRKGRGVVEGVHVDVYIPHESKLGSKLMLRVEVLADYAETLDQTKWQLLTIEAHTISKFAALLDRHASEKGEKDARELLRLLDKGVDPTTATQILVEAASVPIEELPQHLTTVFDLLRDLGGLGRKERREIEKLRRPWNDALLAAMAAHAATRERPPLI